MQEPGNNLPPVSSAEITDEVCRRIHQTPDLNMDYQLARAYHAVLTDTECRQRYLDWMLLNDVFFHQVMRCIDREVSGPDVYKSAAIIFAREFRRELLRSRAGGNHAG